MCMVCGEDGGVECIWILRCMFCLVMWIICVFILIRVLIEIGWMNWVLFVYMVMVGELV